MVNIYKDLTSFIVSIGNIVKNKKFGLPSISEIEKDIKLSADKDLHTQIVTYLNENYPYQILSEEENNPVDYSTIEDSLWIIDPLDGSLNYCRHIPMSCISVALWKNGNPEVGCIYDFNRNDLYFSYDETCSVNDQDVYTSRTSHQREGVLCTGFPSWRDYERESLAHFIKKIQDWKKIRAIGSAALSLSWVARGWVDAYIEEDIRIWDVAAGLALVKAAGGEIYIKQNYRTNFVTAIATNGRIPVESLL